MTVSDTSQQETPNPSPNPPASPARNSDPPKSPEGGRGFVTFVNWFGIVGSFVTIISLILSIYFYRASTIAPDLTYTVHPLKTELRRPDFATDFGFTYAGKPLDASAVTSMQVAIWNAGNRSIKQAEILDPLYLNLGKGSRILSVRLKKASRDVCKFEVQNSSPDWDQGRCRIDWRILEPGDGAVIQVVFVGGSDTGGKLTGTVENQSTITEVAQEFTVLPARFRARGRWSSAWYVICGVILVFLPTALSWLAEKRYTERYKRKWKTPPLLNLVTMGVVVMGIMLATWGVVTQDGRLTPMGPPFGW